MSITKKEEEKKTMDKHKISLYEIAEELFAPTLKNKQYTHIGNAIYCNIDKNKQVTIQITNSYSTDSECDRLQLAVFSKTTGLIHAQTIRFDEILLNNYAIDKTPYVYTANYYGHDGNKYREYKWKKQLTQKDKDLFNNVLQNYTKLFEA